MKTEYSSFKSFMDKHGKRTTEEELIKETKQYYEKRTANEDALLKAYEEKRLTKKESIARAKAIKARRARAKEKKN